MGAYVFSGWAGWGQAMCCPSSRLMAECCVRSVRLVFLEGIAVSCCQHPCTSPSAILSFLWEVGWSGHSFLPEQSHSPFLATCLSGGSEGGSAQRAGWSWLNYTRGRYLFPHFVTNCVCVVGHGRSSALLGSMMFRLSPELITSSAACTDPGRSGLCVVCQYAVLTLALSSC